MEKLKKIFCFRNFLKSINTTDWNNNSLFLSILQEYSLYFVNSNTNWKNLSDDFKKMLINNKTCINLETVKDNLDFEKNLQRFCSCINFKFKAQTKDDGYTMLVKTFAPKQEDTKLLEVGPGMFPASSIVLGKSIKDITIMDKEKFLLSNDCLKRFNISSAINKKFSLDEDTSPYDFVVGQRPCSAIENIVINATQENKPYLIETCTCNLPAKAITDKTPLQNAWENVLPEYDPNIKFYKDFAFNVDASVEQVEKICEKYGVDTRRNSSTNATISSSIVNVTTPNQWKKDEIDEEEIEQK